VYSLCLTERPAIATNAKTAFIFKKRKEIFLFFLTGSTEMFEVLQKCFYGKTALVSYLTEKLTKLMLLLLKCSTQMFFFLSPSQVYVAYFAN